MSRGMTERQLARIQARWFQDFVKVEQISGRVNDKQNLVLVGNFNCFYMGRATSTISNDRQAQNFDATVIVRLPTAFNDRNARYKLTVTQNKSQIEKTDPAGPPESKRTILLESVQIDEYPDPDNTLVFQILRCVNAKN